ncbi:MAG: transcriptional regulator, partial [Paracoccaceae bacterium]|nr:transcriptional regulator [Paracoccaceae bacterium]
LEGSVRSAGKRLRVTVQLIDAINDHHVWAEKYDGDVEAVFDFQDHISGQIASIVEPEVTAAEIKRTSRRPSVDLTVWQLNSRAEYESGAFSPDSLLRAKAFGEQA